MQLLNFNGTRHHLVWPATLNKMSLPKVKRKHLGLTTAEGSCMVFKYPSPIISDKTWVKMKCILSSIGHFLILSSLFTLTCFSYTFFLITLVLISKLRLWKKEIKTCWLTAELRWGTWVDGWELHFQWLMTTARISAQHVFQLRKTAVYAP